MKVSEIWEMLEAMTDRPREEFFRDARAELEVVDYVTEGGDPVERLEAGLGGEKEIVWER